MLRDLIYPPRQTAVDVVHDPAQRRALIVELTIVGVVTFGFSALSAILSLVEAQLGAGIADTTIALNPNRSHNGAIDFTRQLMSAGRLVAFAALAAYLLWRSGVALTKAGLTRRPSRNDVPHGLILAAVIGLPGLGLVALARLLGLNAALIASPTDGPWWQLPMLVLIAIGNAIAEEVVVVGYFITRLRQLDVGENAALGSSALLRGGYHLYQGVGGGVGNVAMGLIFGRFFQRTQRLWPLIIAHATIDVVAFIGYALLADHLGFLR